MADWGNTQATIQAINEAGGVLNAARSAYSNMVAFRAFLTRYQAGTDLVFKGAIDAMLSPAQRAELANMSSDLTPVITDWEANHRSALGLPPLP